MPAGRFTFLGHASFKLETSDGKIVYVDPWLNFMLRTDRKELNIGVMDEFGRVVREE